MYNWLIVMKSGERLWIKYHLQNVEEFLNELLPNMLNQRKLTIAELAKPDKEGNTSVVINGEEISHILFKGK